MIRENGLSRKSSEHRQPSQGFHAERAFQTYRKGQALALLSGRLYEGFAISDGRDLAQSAVWFSAMHPEVHSQPQQRQGA